MLYKCSVGGTECHPAGLTLTPHRLVGLVVTASSSRAADPGIRFSTAPWEFFSGSSHTSDLKIGTTVVVTVAALKVAVAEVTARVTVVMVVVAMMMFVAVNMKVMVAVVVVATAFLVVLVEVLELQDEDKGPLCAFSSRLCSCSLSFFLLLL